MQALGWSWSCRDPTAQDPTQHNTPKGGPRQVRISMTASRENAVYLAICQDTRQLVVLS